MHSFTGRYCEAVLFLLKITAIPAPYYIVIKRTNQALLSLLPVSVVVNNRDIYPLLNTEPVVIALNDDHPVIVVTDGFHISKPLDLHFDRPSYYNLKLVCAISDLQLLGGCLFLSLFYLLGLATGFLLLKLLSFLPIMIFLFWYYINRKNFLRLIPA